MVSTNNALTQSICEIVDQVSESRSSNSQIHNNVLITKDVGVISSHTRVKRISSLVAMVNLIINVCETYI